MLILQPHRLLKFTAQICCLSALCTSLAPAQEAETAAASEIRVFALKYAPADDLAKIVDATVGEKIGGLAVDTRTNSLVVTATKESMEVIEALLARLDQRLEKTRPQGDAAEKNAPAQGIMIRSEVPGSARITMLAPEGKSVQKGDLIIELDDTSVVEQIQRLELELERLKAGELEQSAAQQNNRTAHSGQIDLAQMGLRVAELRLRQVDAAVRLELMAIDGEMSLARAKAEFADRRHDFARSEVEAGQAFPMDAEEFKLVATEAKTQYKLAQAKRKHLEDIVRPLRLATADLDLSKTKVALENVRRQAELIQQKAAAQQSVAHAQLQQVEARLARLADQRAKCKIYAPAKGVVHIANDLVKKGALVRQGQGLLRLQPK